MRKFPKFLILLGVLCLLAAVLFLERDTLPGWNPPEELPYLHRSRVEKEILDSAALLGEDPHADIDRKEALLIDAGYTVLDTDESYPACLANADRLTRFWESISAGKDASLSVLRIGEDGSLWHLYFLCEGSEALFFSTAVSWDEQGDPKVLESGVLPVYDMELTDWGIFYYQVYPSGDPHYIDYGQFRLEPANREAYDLNRKYILPVGYMMVNLFLCDWQEGDWGDLSFPDLLDTLYLKNTGHYFEWGNFPITGSPSRVLVPATLFEENILPYFQISPEELRELCQYDEGEDCYSYRPIRGDDLTAWKYPMCEPEVTGWVQNPDGTITLTVQVYSPELKTDRLFIHEVTVRPLDGEQFQYVGNRITYVSQRGLPPNMARFALDE